ncbi:alpha-D-ribose 1-methylphosphonate 5-triphosphate diphosphatase [Sulfuriferula thiophila]|jgi:alpha-D-ribose 1-methylphosphonate 5-triphosphate diphosphatase|uniref:alpha-D-ribose 1-methylphosphonate 5-triphosphate diphosphatase n=1 Tax=Sulfuriferula thiophila TaxID=1781211 RepID=UPI000F60D952|nr:alpha-D-ribose 1-methylphosphonate 5-triphosphate diphosphatase [Sulfuriferula thiophila]MDD4979468.1 alpha-D-ribose 1-methylphosphonate 5-triphosphate diphosphatase [Gallionella sp.]
MNNHFYLTGAQVVLENETLKDAAVLIADGKIVAINPASSAGAQEIDLRGQTLMPGMIDLHCDALEKEAEPRPGVHFPFDFACAQADKRNAAAGITTIYHALSFANAELGVRNNNTAAELARAVHAWQEHALVDNRVHARYEITDPTAPDILNELLGLDEIHLMSFMDHTPGQGQFKSVDAYRDFLSRTYKKDAAEFEILLANKLAQGEGAVARMEQLAQHARELGIPLASHDDDRPEKVDVVKKLGVSVSEFPINLETAQAARAAGLATLFGAPNILRGKSQSGSMRALDAVKEGVADCLCGDYSPAALLPAVLKLPELAGIKLHEAVALVTCNPARAVGLKDRGVIAAGKRADLLAVRHLGGLPQVSRVWSEGLQVMTLAFDHGA